jgi:aminopeptidase
VRFENGRAVEVKAASGEEVMRTHVATDEGAAQLGEVALVDGHSAVGKTGLVFYDTLFDENASSHIALGAAIVQAVPGAHELSAEDRVARGVNQSSIHTDFMIGSNELEIDGVTKDGDPVPILRSGDWVL